MPDNNKMFTYRYKNAVNLLLIRGVKICQSLFTFYLLTTLFDKQTFGYYAYTYSIAMSFVVLSYFGSEQLGPKLLAKSQLFIGRLVVLKLFFTLILVVIFYSLVQSLYSVTTSDFILTLCVYMLFNMELLIFSYFNIRNKLSILMLITLGTFILTSIVKGLTLIDGKQEFLYLGIVGDVAIPLVTFLFYLYNNNSLSFDVKKTKFFYQRFFSNLAPLFLAAFLIQVNIRVDSYFISSFVGGEALSTYSIALKVNEVFAVLVSSTIAYFSPALFRSKNNIQLNLVIFKVLKIISSLLIIAIICTFGLYDYVNQFVFDGEYSDVKKVLLILFVSTFFGSMSALVGLWFIYYKREKSKLKRILFALLLNLLISFLLIPTFGILGASITSLIVNFSLAIIFNVFNKDLRGLMYEGLSKKKL
jgi:O-antigen/teichoic acid export membrane protein